MKKNKFLLKVVFVVICLAIFLAFFASAKKNNILKIGSILTLTGDAASYGQMMKKGMELAKDKIIQENLLHNMHLKIFYEDSQFNPKLGINAYKKLVHIDKVNAIVNVIGSAVVIPLVSLAEKDHIVILDALSTSPVLNRTSNMYIRICPSDDYVGGFIATWIKEFKKENVVILYMNDDWGVGVSNAVAKKGNKLNLNIIMKAGINPGIRSVRDLIAKIRIKKPEIIVLACRPRETVVILKELRENKILVPVIGTDNMVSDEVANLPKSILNNTYYCVPKIDKTNKLYRIFIKDFKKIYNKEPNIVSAYAYATLYLMSEAVSKVGLNTEKIIKYIIENDHNSIIGKLKFDNNGNMISAKYAKYVFKDGKRVCIK